MLIPSHFNRCILCLKKLPLSKEHVFPESIGGRFQALILCTPCNNNRGAQLAATIQKDSWYLAGLKHLQNELPDLYKNTSFKYASRAPDGTVIYSSIKNGIHKVATKTAQDGTITTDEKNTDKIIQGLLSQKGYNDSDLKDWGQKCNRLSPNTEIRIGKDLLVKKKSGPLLVPKLEGDGTCEFAAALIGYEFLSLRIGEHIYDSEFNYLRDFILTGSPSKEINLEMLYNNNTNNYRPRHEIMFMQNGDKLIITVKFLGASIYRITLANLVWKTPGFVFIEDIKQRKSFIASSIENAKNSIFHEIGD